MFEQFVHAVMRAIQIGVLIGLPLWVRYMVTSVMHHHDGIGYFAIPGLARLSFFSGAVFGGVLLYVNHDARFYYFDTVFAEGGPWDLPFFEFFRVWLNPLRYSPITLWNHVAPLDIDDNVTAFTLISAAFGAAATASAVAYFRRQFHWAILKNVAVWLWAAVTVIYIVCAAAWVLNVLNFWAVVLVFLFVRHRSLAAH